MRFVIAERAYDLLPHLLPDLFLEMGGWKRLSHRLSCRRPSCTEGACQPGLQAIQDRNCPISQSSLWQVANPLHPISLPLPHSSLFPKRKNRLSATTERQKSQAVPSHQGFQVLQAWFPFALMEITCMRYLFICHFFRKTSRTLLSDFVHIHSALSHKPIML